MPRGNGPLDPLEPFSDVCYFRRHLAARGALEDGSDIAGVAEMPGSGLPFELLNHLDRQPQRGGCHRLRLDPVARLHLRAGVVRLVVLSQPLKLCRGPRERFGSLGHVHRAFLRKVFFSTAVMSRAVTINASSSSVRATTSR